MAPLICFRSLGAGIAATGNQNCFLLTCEEEGKTSGLVLDSGQTVGNEEWENGSRRLSPEQRPDLEPLRGINIVGIPITHIHLDHIGAVEDVVEACPRAPVVCSPFVLRFLRDEMLSEKIGSLRWTMQEANSLGPFEILSFPVLHSTPESLAFGIRVSGGPTVIYSGDLKTPGPEKSLSPRLQRKYRKYYRALDEMGKMGGNIKLILDATRADEEGYAGIEEDVVPHLEKIIVGNPMGRVFLTFISSNIERVENILEISARYGRRVYVAGSALERKLYIARKNGWTALNRDSLACMPRDAIVLVTGCQGERNSFLRRLAEDTLRFDLHITASDVLAVAADTIPDPGTWKQFGEIMEKLSGFFGKIILTHSTPPIKSLGAEISRAPIHVPGHGKAGDIRDTLEAVQPSLLIPFHGDFAKRRAMEKIAQELGIASLVLEGCETAALLP